MHSESHSRQESSESTNITGSCLYDLLRLDTPTDWGFNENNGKTASSENTEEDSDKEVGNLPTMQLRIGPHGRLENLMSEPGNRFCADCGSPEPKWQFYVLLLDSTSIRCCSIVMFLSQVLSVNLDEWTDDEVNVLTEMGGNTIINMKYEACIPEYYKKPKPDSSIEERADFIWRKYELLQFTNTDESLSCPFPYRSPPTHSNSSSLDMSSSGHEKKQNSVKNTQSHRSHWHAFRHSRRRKDSHDRTHRKSSLSAGMVEFIGLIKVNVVRGSNLAVRDMISSDPYVILSLGDQSVKTRVIKKNLNPVWNEQLMLSIPEDVPPLKLLVYDKDRFSTDDFMGEAEIDIQPLVSAAKASENSKTEDSVQLGQWVESKENALEGDGDGVFNMVEGKVKQEIALKLQNVERGVLHIELECVSLTQ
ncbi:hypothetical protein LguiB_011276 [Lonicera macranthoides]